MTASRESWTKIGAVIAGACGFAGFCFGLLHSLMPNGGFIRDLCIIAAVTGTGLICSFAFDKRARMNFLIGIVIICVLMVAAVCVLKFELKDAVAAALSACKRNVDYSRDPDAWDPRNYSKYWREY